jgi:carbamoyltransferase
VSHLDLPVVLEEDAHEYFDLDRPSPYMQFAVRCKRPDLLPAVIHKDGTSRVQTVNQYQHFGLYEVLQRWKVHTGIPVLLNTTLNVKNQPLLDDFFDVERWKRDNPYVRIVT